MPRKVAIVTGGSRGIGAATARLAARHDYAVCINYRERVDDAEAVVRSIERNGGSAVAVQADTSDPQQVRRLFTVVDQELGPVTALVNNAGISGGRASLVDTSVEILRRVLDVNLVGYVLCAQEAVRRMSTIRGGQGGAIVNVSSQAGTTGGYRMAHYAASKAAVNALTVSLAREFAAEGIRVNAVSPGVIKTEQQDLSDPDRMSQVLRDIPIGRIGTPEEVAEVIAWLLSDKASYVTGAIVPVSGGR